MQVRYGDCSMKHPPAPAIDRVWLQVADDVSMFAWVTADDGRMLWANRRWLDELDADAIGAPWMRQIADADVAATQAAWRTGNEDFTTSATLIDRSGLPRRLQMTLHRDDAGRWIGMAADDAARQRAETAHDAARAELDVLTNAMPQMVWATRPDGHHEFYNAQWYRFTGVAEGSTDGEGWSDMFHVDDRERAWARWQHSLATGDPYEIEYRLRHRSGNYRWVLGRALPVRNDDGSIRRWIGTCTDIDSARRAAEQNEILSRELSHRIKNIFAVISGLVRMSARRMPEVRGFADDLAGRIGALGAAHDLARPHSERSRPSVGEATLHTILRELLAPYAAGQWQVTGDDVAIDDRGATPIALVFHELATNAAKYGALSVPDGTLTLQTKVVDDAVSIEWHERGGPPVGAAPDTTGFGTRLAQLSIEQQLGGTIERDWRREGLIVRIGVARGALVRD